MQLVHVTPASSANITAEQFSLMFYDALRIDCQGYASVGGFRYSVAFPLFLNDLGVWALAKDHAARPLVNKLDGTPICLNSLRLITEELPGLLSAAINNIPNLDEVRLNAHNVQIEQCVRAAQLGLNELRMKLNAAEAVVKVFEAKRNRLPVAYIEIPTHVRLEAMRHSLIEAEVCIDPKGTVVAKIRDNWRYFGAERPKSDNPLSYDPIAIVDVTGDVLPPPKL